MRPGALLLLGALALPCSGMTLSAGIHARGQGSRRCLKFMHVPKAAGGSIVDVGLTLPPEERPFTSLELEINDALMAANPWYTGERSKVALHVNLTLAEEMGIITRFLTNLDGERCKTYHVAPSGDPGVAPRGDPGVAAYFSERGCETFCVVREPVSKFLSAARMDFSMSNRGTSLCTPEEFEDYTRHTLSAMQHHSGRIQCLFTKQVDMVYGVPRKSMAEVQYCTRILRFENIAEEFNSLMREYGSNLTMPTTHTHSYVPGCDLTPDTLTPATRDMILDHYSEDVAAFGYGSLA